MQRAESLKWSLVDSVFIIQEDFEVFALYVFTHWILENENFAGFTAHGCQKHNQTTIRNWTEIES